MSLEYFPEPNPNSDPDNVRLPDCDYVLILQNEYGTAAKMVQEEIDSLNQKPRLDIGSGRTKFIVVSTEIDRQETLDKIYKVCDDHEGEKLGIINAGGDYTQNIGLEAAMNREEIKIAGSIAGGNVNAIAFMANRERIASNIINLIKFGNTAPLHPVSIIAEEPNGKVTERLAFAFFGAGITSGVALKADSKDHRHRAKGLSERQLFVEEAKLTVDTIKRQDPLIIEDNNGDRHIQDISVVNGPKIAKAVRIGFNQLTDPKAAVIETAYPGRGRLIPRLALTGVAMAKGFVGAYPRIILGGEPYSFKLSYEDEQKNPHIKTHFEGQPEDFISGTTFNVAIHRALVMIQTANPKLAEK